ncbi:MAG: NAD(P)/FAD-dependent oxidoreductase [Nitrospirae bacterium]|uniref:NAD(P)/FAD-dependent oxidoreductase n=1 Tax=Candidatus Magnetobacterium casense TaxID=1455061 RepID=UPI000ABB507A|nr:FAD-dependent oxidoreductase [Candidatus Magnetobacterium casensis]MBF0337454.1 NAD(P)/FAD-dependent oxidoreductase [Nitrospirota bacterium]
MSDAPINRIVIVGGGIAGVSAAEAARKVSAQAKVILISKEPYLPYYRINLTRYLAGEVSNKELEIHPASWYKDKDIDILLGAELSGIDLQNKTLAMTDGSTQSYDKLILTVGSQPFVPAITGADKSNVTVLRTMADAEFLLDNCQGQTRCVCIGGGLLGLETAGALSKRGVNVTLLEGYDWLLPRQLNQKAGNILQRHISKDFTIHNGVKTREIIGQQRADSVVLDNGTEIATDMVIVTTGVRSNTDLAGKAGLTVNNGIIVDDTMATSDPDVYAAGDAAEHEGVIYGTWVASMSQGSIAGTNAAGQHAEFKGMPRSNMLKVLGYDMFSIGEINPDSDNDKVIEGELDDGSYYYFMFRNDHMAGAILLGSIKLSAAVKKAIEKKIDCSSLLNANKGVQDVISFLKNPSA